MTTIVLCTKNPFANVGAASNRLLGLLKGLKRQGVEVRILILQGYFNENEATEFLISGSIDGIQYNYFSTRKNITLWQRRFTAYVKIFFETYFLSRKLNSLLRNTPKNTVLWPEDNALCYKLIGKLKYSDAKIFLELNEYPDVHKSNNSEKFFWQRWISERRNKIFDNYILGRLDGLALMTQTLIEYYKDRLDKRTKVLHLPMTVELNRFDLNEVYNPIFGVDLPYICFVGSMNNTKDGVNLLIESFATISKFHPEIKLALFGFWAYDTPSHQLRIKELGIQDKVIYSKPIDSYNVVNLLMNAKVLVLPRPDSYQAKGGFPTKLGEYLASSRPVIATKVGEIPNYLKNKESAILIEPGSVESLANALKVTLTNPILAQKIGLQGRKVAEKHFCSDVQSQRLYRFLQSIVLLN